MAAQTGSTYVCESMIDIIKISTANLRFSNTASSNKVSLGDYNNDRQPEMADETGNTYISETMTDIIEIPTANPTHSTMGSMIAKWLRQRPTTGSGKIGAQNGYIAIFSCAVA